MTVIAAFLYRNGHRVRSVPIDERIACAADTSEFVWIGVADPTAEEMAVALKSNTAKHGIAYFDLPSGKQGIVHVVGPEQGLTQPGTTICCGDWRSTEPLH